MMREKTKITEELLERYELVRGRIREIPGDDPLPELFRDYFQKQAAFLLELDRLFGQFFGQGCEFSDSLPVQENVQVEKRSLEECRADQKILYADITENYEKSYANPTFAGTYFKDKKTAEMLSFLAAELRRGIACVFEGRLEDWVILLELFAEIYSCFCQEEPDLQEANQTIYWHFHDYSGRFTEEQIADMTEPADSRRSIYADILMHADLSDLRYLYRYGLPVGENEIGTAEFLNSLSEEQIQSMADTFTEGYRIGFEVTGKDIRKKKTVSLHYQIGFERMMRAAARNFEKMGLSVTLEREPSSSFRGIGNKRGVYSTSPNRQFDYDHREDRAFYFDKRFVEHRLDMLEGAFEQHKEAARTHGGPAFLDVFGEAPFSPEAKDTIRYSSEQQKLSVYNMSRSGQVTNAYVPGEERSFTIIAWPVPAIGPDYKAIFSETVKINTLDYKKYQQMQQHLIDVLDQAERAHISGKDGNETDLIVSIWPLEHPESQTAFENCVADVNIPVGEVFTSPVLKGTNGLLHVSEVFLNGLRFTDLKICFQDGMVAEYSCGNFEDPDEGKKYIRENVLMHHETLPMGEFAIGTNTTAYAMGRRYHINDRLPILIAEKTGPHFAVGDTCYSHAEDTAVFNPDGKEIMPRDNAISILRKEDPAKAYFGCHTDITIPFAELDRITAIGKDGQETDLIRDGRFVVPGTEELNEPLMEPETF